MRLVAIIGERRQYTFPSQQKLLLNSTAPQSLFQKMRTPEQIKARSKGSACLQRRRLRLSGRLKNPREEDRPLKDSPERSGCGVKCGVAAQPPAKCAGERGGTTGTQQRGAC